MSSAEIYSALSFEDSGVSLLARIVGVDGSNIQQADVSSISLYIKDITNDSELQTDKVVVVADDVFDTLQTDARWTIDDTGYNFRYDVLAAELPTGAALVRFEFKFVPTTGAVYHTVFEVKTINLLRS